MILSFVVPVVHQRRAEVTQVTGPDATGLDDPPDIVTLEPNNPSELVRGELIGADQPVHGPDDHADTSANSATFIHRRRSTWACRAAYEKRTGTWRAIAASKATGLS